jgi:protein-L-isoaspartate(D-aspartate) O-methyltransferase|uniref:Protein-L-isoaspartate O-methyltransferase n=1 Tax=candidate division WOR-3 bacterium TaxID=2052148 RepID=A0A7C3Z1J3_UNCW3
MGFSRLPKKERTIWPFLLFIIFFLSCGGRKVKKEENDYTKLRKLMVQEQIAKRGIKDKRVLEAMETVPRHLFVPEDLRDEAYNDYPLPIGEEQTISQPYIVALMTELLELKGRERVLEIGTGSGYQAAILAHLCKEVYTIEIIEKLAQSAAERLKKMGYTNIFVRWGDGFEGWPEYAPFDDIIITCAIPEVPSPLLDQLKDGGKICAPYERTPGVQILTVFKKRGAKLDTNYIDYVRFVPMRGKIEGIR